MIAFGDQVLEFALVHGFVDEPELQEAVDRPGAGDYAQLWPFLEEIGKKEGFDVAHWGGGYDEDGLTERELDELACFLEGRELVLAVLGQKASHDAEAWDRPSMQLAPADLEIVDALKASGKRFAVVLVGGGAMDVRPFAAEAEAVLMGWLGGEAFGGALADVVYGRSHPSGKLSETFAWSVDDHALRRIAQDVRRGLSETPNVSRIDVLQSNRDGDTLNLLNEWHAKAEIPSIAKRVIILNRGTIMADGSPREILTDRDLLETARLEPPILTRLFQELSEDSNDKHRIPVTIDEAIRMLRAHQTDDLSQRN